MATTQPKDTPETPTAPEAVETPQPAELELTPPAPETAPEAPKGRRGRPSRATTPEPELVLGDVDTPAKPAASSRTKKPAAGEVSVTDITNGIVTALQALSQFSDPLLPYGGVGLWVVTADEAKKIAGPAAKIIHRHGGGKALHPDVVDGIMLAQAVAAAVIVRYQVIQQHAQAQAAAAAAQVPAPVYQEDAPFPKNTDPAAGVDMVEEALRQARGGNSTVGTVGVTTEGLGTETP